MHCYFGGRRLRKGAISDTHGPDSHDIKLSAPARPSRLFDQHDVSFFIRFFSSLANLWIQILAMRIDVMSSFSSPSYTTMPRNKSACSQRAWCPFGHIVHLPVSFRLIFCSVYGIARVRALMVSYLQLKAFQILAVGFDGNCEFMSLLPFFQPPHLPYFQDETLPTFAVSTLASLF